MSAVYTSRVWTCWDAVYDALQAATWPAHPRTNKVPPVVYSGSSVVAQEMITVPGMRMPQNPINEDATVGIVGQDQRFTLVIHIFSEVPGFIDTTPKADPSRLVRHRIRDLSMIVENTFRNPVSGRPQGITILNVWNYLITATIPAIGVIEGGYSASVTHHLTFDARI